MGYNRRCSVNDKALAKNIVFLIMTRSKERRRRTSSKYVYYALQLYSSGLSLKKTLERLSNVLIRRNYVSIWNWIQRHKPKRIFQFGGIISEFIIDETLIKAGSD